MDINVHNFMTGVSHLELMVNHLLSLCCESLSYGFDMTTSILLLQTIQRHYPQVLNSAVTSVNFTGVDPYDVYQEHFKF